MDLYSRIELIVNYILDTNIYGPLIETTRGIKPETEEERYKVREDGTKTISRYVWLCSDTCSYEQFSSRK